MKDILNIIIYSFVLVSSLIYIWHKLLEKRINFRNHRLYITLFGLIVCAVFNYFLMNKFIKITIITIIFMIFFRYLFKENIKKCIITPIFYQLIIMVSESIYALTITYIFHYDTESIINTFLGTFLTNIMVAIISLIIVQLTFIKKLYLLFLKITSEINIKQLLILCLFLIIIANILAMTMYYKIKFQYLMIFNLSLTLICAFIVAYSFKTQNSYNKVSDKYNIAINSLKDYEEMMNKYRVANHENKNLLLTIRAMVLSKEKDIPKFINSIVKEKYNDNEKLLFKVNVIPSGGLRATIYSEILKIKKKNIQYSLNIDSNLKTVDLIELETNVIINICKILGVFIDNAIEEVEKLNKKYIGINLYRKEDYLNIEISNNYNNSIEIDKIYERGFTTKGKGHGYGLSLVRKIINDNEIFKNHIILSKENFTQVLSIKLKNSIKKGYIQN